MPVKLIDQKEKLVLEIEGSKFFYRRLKPIERQNIIHQHTKRGETDFGKAALAMIKLCLLGWENVQDVNGNKVKFDVDLVEDFPEEVLVEIQTATSATSGQEVLEKNSKTALAS